MTDPTPEALAKARDVIDQWIDPWPTGLVDAVARLIDEVQKCEVCIRRGILPSKAIVCYAHSTLLIEDANAEGARAERKRLMPWIDHIKACPWSPELHGEDSERDCTCGLTTALAAAPEMTDGN